FARVGFAAILCAALVASSEVSGHAQAFNSILKNKPSKPAVSGQRALTSSGARRALATTKTQAPPPVTTDTWTGGGGSNTNWSDASNWNNGAITTGENIVINT